MARTNCGVVLLVALVCTGVTPAEGQKVKLKNEGIKGTFVTANCQGPTLCTLIDLSTAAPDQYLYLTQVCFTNTAVPGANEAGMRISTNASGEIAAAFVEEFETECISFDPARLVQPNDTLECHESRAVATSHCSASGVLAKK
jgi:hypothetical protein